MGIVIIGVVGLLVITGAIALMVRMDRENKRRVRRRRELWEAAGGEGAPPGDYMGSGGGGLYSG